MADGKPRQNRGGSDARRSSPGKPGGSRQPNQSNRGSGSGSGSGRSRGSSGSGDAGARGSSGKSGSSSGSKDWSKGGSSKSSKAGGSSKSGGSGRREYSKGKPDSRGSHTAGRPQQREKLRVAGSGGGDLPKWIRDEILRSTPKERRDGVLALLSEAADAFADARYTVSRERLLRAKALSSRSATVRELLGLSSYRLGSWEEALRELRAFRRIAGDTTHLAVEMDCLRALGREDDISKVWTVFRQHGSSKGAEVELRVVYGSFLLDQGRARDAWQITDPGRIRPDAHENDLRQWYVAARAAIALGDMKTASQLRKAIEDRDIAFPGLSELVNEINELS